MAVYEKIEAYAHGLCLDFPYTRKLISHAQEMVGFTEFSGRGRKEIPYIANCLLCRGRGRKEILYTTKEQEMSGRE